MAKVRDLEGNSGSYLGQQLEDRLRWEIGGAYLFKGGFANDAPNTNNEGDSKFLYSQTIFSF